MIGILFAVLIALIIVGLVTWLIQTFVPAPAGIAANIKQAIIYIIWVVFLIWILYQLAAAFGGAPFPRIVR